MTLRWLIHLYPRVWQRRYGEEFADLLAEQPISPHMMLDVLLGALDAQTRLRWSVRSADRVVRLTGSGTPLVVSDNRVTDDAAWRRDNAMAWLENQSRAQAAAGLVVCLAVMALLMVTAVYLAWLSLGSSG